MQEEGSKHHLPSAGHSDMSRKETSDNKRPTNEEEDHDGGNKGREWKKTPECCGKWKEATSPQYKAMPLHEDEVHRQQSLKKR